MQKASDRSHKVRLAFGNGLRMDIWKEFKERFHIATIAEFYGATEGSSSMLNVANKIGAVGRLSPLLVSETALVIPLNMTHLRITCSELNGFWLIKELRYTVLLSTRRRTPLALWW